jgi:hypothetical protein
VPLIARSTRAGAALLALGLVVHVILGPWAARWYLVMLWLAVALAFARAPRERTVPLGLIMGFVAIAAVTAARAAGWSSPWLLGPFYLGAAVAAVSAFISSGSDSDPRSSGPP